MILEAFSDNWWEWQLEENKGGTAIDRVYICDLMGSGHFRYENTRRGRKEAVNKSCKAHLFWPLLSALCFSVTVKHAIAATGLIDMPDEVCPE